MPQPLRRWMDDIEFTHDALKQRPELAASISTISAFWSEIELEMGLMLAVMLGTEAYTGVSMYLALAGSPAQRASLFAAANAAELPEDLLTNLRETVAAVKDRAGERNRVVHALWSLHPKDDKQLICCRPENLVRLVAKASKSISPSDQFTKIFEVFRDDPPEDFVKDLRCYRKEDFEAILTRIDTLKDQVAKTGSLIGDYLDQKRLPPDDAQESQPQGDADASPHVLQTRPPEQT
jgi:hypothetical protein